VFADLVGKGCHVRTVPVPLWVAAALQKWITDAKITDGPICRALNKAGRIAAHGFRPKSTGGVVKEACHACKLGKVAPHDLRRTCARLCHERGGELEQIEFLLGHVSVQTTEPYLGCKQRLRDAVNDSIADRAGADSTVTLADLSAP
jgi:integrase